MKFTGVLAMAAVASGEVYFKETFGDGEAWEKRWVHSDNKVSEGSAGKVTLSAGEFFGGANHNTCAQLAWYSCTKRAPTNALHGGFLRTSTLRTNH